MIRDLTNEPQEVHETAGILNYNESSEINIHNAFMQLQVAIVIIKGADYTIEFANDFYFQLIREKSEIIGGSVFFSFPEMSGQDPQELIDQVIQTGKPLHLVEQEVYLPRSNHREQRYCNMDFQPVVRLDRTVSGVIVICNDVTEEARSRMKLSVIVTEKNLEKSLKEVSDYKFALDESSIVSITDHKGIIKYANDNFCKISKYQCSELIGQDHRIINSGYHSKDFIGNLWATIKKGNIWKGELRNKAKDGSIYWVDTTIVPFLDEEGKPYQYIVIRTDITRQKRNEQELTDARGVAEQATLTAKAAQSNAETATDIAKNAMRAKQQFLSNMSHEIRTPMNAIIGFTKVVLKTELSPKQTEYLSAIKTSGDALIVLINDILDLAKVDSGKMTFEKIPFKLASSISAMLVLFETKIQEKNLVLIKEYDSRIPAVLVGDPVRLHQIIINLVSNAIKFTNVGEIHVIVRLIGETQEHVKIEFLVTDTGIGVSEVKRETIFENFQQAASSTSRIYGGTGLGLAIVKQLVELQGGHVSVVSEVGKGSTFRFVLDFEKTQAEAESIIDTMLLDPDVKDTKVLVVEDMALNQLLMKTLLDDFGFQSDIAANGKIAIDKMRGGKYDIILMDLQMPEMDGFEATHYIRNSLNLNIPIMALTADVTTVDVAKCKAVGMNDYIAKPVDERILYAKMVGLIKKAAPVPHTSETESESQPVRYIDLAYLHRRTKSNPVLMMEMISLYLEQTPPLISIIKQSYQQQNWPSLYSALHKIIPSFAIMGINTAHETIAKKVQEYAADQQLESGISEMIVELENICFQACQELETELHRIKNLSV